MAGQHDIKSILAALAQRPGSAPGQGAPQPPGQAQQMPGFPPGFPGVVPTPTPPTALQGFSLPQPTNIGSLDLSSIKPVNTGSVSIADAIAKARGIAAEKGLSRDDPRVSGRSYRRSRSRSRSPPRRDGYRDSYNPYRDERRDDPRRGGLGHGRDRSRSPSSRGRDTFSPSRTHGRGRSPVDENSELIFIDSALVGLVIGRQGENLRRIEQDTNTRIQFITGPNDGSPQRQCRVSGQPRARAEAKREINRIIEENGGNPTREAVGGRASAAPASNKGGNSKNNQQPALREGENSVQIMVPDRTVGLIIGRGGETIRDLQERSGCHVNIVGENKSVNGLRPVNLIGSPQSASKAKKLIMEIVESDTRLGPPAGQPASRSNVSEGFSTEMGSNKLQDHVVVPSDAVGMIIGKGGETIKEMQNQTGCKINVSPPSGADVERHIELVGSRAAVEDAKRVIWEKVDQAREKSNARARGSGRGDQDNFSDRHSQQQQPHGQQQNAGQAMPQQLPQEVPGADGSSQPDPYAPWGGYQNYVAMWYAALAQQGQQAPGQGEQPRPPGA